MPTKRTKSLPSEERRPDAVPASSMLPLWRSIHQEFTTRAQKWNLPVNASMTLVHLHVHPEDGEPALLAELTHFPRQTMTFVLDALEERGLVRRVAHPSDRRRKRIEVTREGRTLGARMFKDLLAFEAIALAAIPSGSHDLFKHLVGCYADALARHNATHPTIGN